MLLVARICLTLVVVGFVSFVMAYVATHAGNNKTYVAVAGIGGLAAVIVGSVALALSLIAIWNA